MKNYQKSNIVFKIIAFIVLSFFSLFILGLIFWGFITSFKHVNDFFYYPTSLFPKSNGFQFSNYSVAYFIMHIVIDAPGGGSRYVYIEEMLGYSALWVIGSTVFQVATTLVVSYCCARFSKRVFSTVIYYVVVVAISLPIIGSLPAQMTLLHHINLYDNLLVIPVLKANFVSTYFLVFYGVFLAIPKAYREAAEIDGAGHFTIFIRIMVPFVSNTVIAVSILNIIAHWNDYTTPMLYLPSYPTVAQGLYDLMLGQSSRHKDLTDAVSLAAAFMTSLPTLILFCVFRNRIMTNITLGGLKG